MGLLKKYSLPTVQTAQAEGSSQRQERGPGHGLRGALLNKGALLRFWFRPHMLSSHRELPAVYRDVARSRASPLVPRVRIPWDLAKMQIWTQQVSGEAPDAAFLI